MAFLHSTSTLSALPPMQGTVPSLVKMTGLSLMALASLLFLPVLALWVAVAETSAAPVALSKRH